MVSRQETARPLLTPGEIMQLPPSEELVLVSGLAPIRATKARCYADRRLAARVMSPPQRPPEQDAGHRPIDPWSRLVPLTGLPMAAAKAGISAPAPHGDDEAAVKSQTDAANGGIRLRTRDPASRGDCARDSALPVAQAKGRERYDGFVESLGRWLAKGRSLADEVSADVTART